MHFRELTDDFDIASGVAGRGEEVGLADNEIRSSAIGKRLRVAEPEDPAVSGIDRVKMVGTRTSIYSHT